MVRIFVLFGVVSLRDRPIFFLGDGRKDTLATTFYRAMHNSAKGGLNCDSIASRPPVCTVGL